MKEIRRLHAAVCAFNMWNLIAHYGDCLVTSQGFMPHSPSHTSSNFTIFHLSFTILHSSFMCDVAGDEGTSE
jgi:hypothetical protein